MAAVAVVGASGARAPKPVVLSSGRLDTGFVDPQAFSGARAADAFRRVAGAGGSYARLTLAWAEVAPRGSERPVGFDAADPADPHYSWSAFDRQARAAVAAGLEPIVSVYLAPAWAERGTAGGRGTKRPDPSELALFARAAATRFSGKFEGLPRIRYWQVWNEPNLDWFLMPQFDGARAVSPAWYRTMVNRFAAAVKAVDATNLVVAGGTSPFGDPGRVVAPLAFMRELLCMAGRPLRPTCKVHVHFDIWAHHPYSMGGPFHQAAHPDNVSVGDLPEMQRLLTAAIRAGHVVHSRPVAFWVTEFSWDTNPPDPKGVPIRLHARWVAEALFQMWRSQVSLVTWFRLADEPLAKGSFQSGLYFQPASNGLSRGKPALTAFHFPFVAYRNDGVVSVWGRTPSSSQGAVSVEQRVRGRWQTLRVIRAASSGIFRARVNPRGGGDMRARLVGHRDASLPFSLHRPPDLILENPFGS